MDRRDREVSCDASGKVAVIDTKAWEVRTLIPAGPVVDGLAWAPAADATLSRCSFNFTFTDTNTANYPLRFYRALLAH
jgi:hypothetical protein